MRQDNDTGRRRRCLVCLAVAFAVVVCGGGRLRAADAAAHSGDVPTTAALAAAVNDAWNGITSLSGTLTLHWDVKDWPEGDDAQAGGPLAVLNEEVSTVTTRFLFAPHRVRIETDRVQRHRPKMVTTKVFDRGRATAVQGDTSPTLVRGGDGALRQEDILDLMQYFGLIGIFPGCLPVDDATRTEYAVICSLAKPKAYQVAYGTYEGKDALIITELHKSRRFLDRKTLTPLGYERFDMGGNVTMKARFGKFVPVPGTSMQLPTEIESETWMDPVRGHRPYHRRVMMLENLRVNESGGDEGRS